MSKIVDKIKRTLLRLRLQPIRVFCFHQVSKEFDATTMWPCDWTEIEQFQQIILDIRKEHTFVSIAEAHTMLKNDIFRRKKYAVLTCDDGWESILSILPWLHEQRIPITLFLNPAYLQKLDIRENGMSRLLTIDQIKELVSKYPTISIASHGWNHDDCSLQDKIGFHHNVNNSVQYLRKEKCFVPFFAYPCGRHTVWQDKHLLKNNIIPVYCDGQKNYKDKNIIHRECIDYETLRNHPML